MNISNFIQELKRRNVFKVAAAYAIAGWLIIQIATSVFPAFEFPGWTTQFVIILVGIGFPLALIFAWAFELTPDGLQKSKEVEITESVTSSTGKKLNGIIITVLSMAVIFLIVERVFFAKASILENASGETSFETASIAVLPFVNMSSDAENEYFSDGLSEELLNGLAKLEDIQVAGRTSSFQFKDTNPDLRDVGNQLGVKHILEGSVRKSGNSVRITAQLIQADNGFHLWSETYDRELTANAVFDIQEEITRKVVSELKVRLLPEEDIIITERPTEDIEAYNAYLEALQLQHSFRVEDIEKAIQKYQEAISIDPTFAEAYASIAVQYERLHFYGNLPLEETKELMKSNIDQALLMNGNLGTAYHALSIYYYLISDDENAEIAAKRAVEIAPNDAAFIYNYSTVNEDNAERELLLIKAYNLDPLNPEIANDYAYFSLVRNDKYNDALNMYDQIIERNPEYTWALESKAFILRDSPYGKIDQAFEFLHKGWKKDPENLVLMYSLADVALDVEFFEYAKYLTDKMKQIYPDNNLWMLQESLISDAKGDHKESLEMWEKYINSYQLDEDNYAQVATANLEFNLGNYLSAAEIYKQGFPEYLNPDFEVTTENYWITIQMGAVLKKAGDTANAAQLIELTCEFTKSTLDNLQGGEDPYSKLSRHIRCLIASGKFEEATKSLEVLHFEQKSKANWPEIFRNEPVFKDFNVSPEFAEIKAKIFADLHSMRSEIITYLKAEGEWKEEWGESKN